MKKIVFFLAALLCVELSAQKITYDTILTVSESITDTVIKVPMRKADGRFVQIDINTLDADTDTIDAGFMLDDYAPAGFGSMFIIDFPVVADKETYRYYDSDVTYKSRISINSFDGIPAKYFFVRYKRVDSTEGYIVLVYL